MRSATRFVVGVIRKTAIGLLLVTGAAAAVHPQQFSTHGPAMRNVERSKATVRAIAEEPKPVAAPQPRPPVSRPVSYQPAPASHAVGNGTRTALLVGVNTYDESNPAVGGTTDAKNLKSALLKYGWQSDNITILLDGEATRGRILAELNDLAARTPSNGLAVFSASSHGSGSSFKAAGGARVYATEVANALGRVRGSVWTILGLCYAGGFAKPGIVGNNRLATFSSASDQLTYEIGSAGTELFYYMVKKGMIEGAAPQSVERAFYWARSTLANSGHDNLPVISDGIDGDLVLGPATWGAAAPKPASKPSSSSSTSKPKPSATPTPTQPPSNGGVFGGLL